MVPINGLLKEYPVPATHPELFDEVRTHIFINIAIIIPMLITVQECKVDVEIWSNFICEQV